MFICLNISSLYAKFANTGFWLTRFPDIYNNGHANLSREDCDRITQLIRNIPNLLQNVDDFSKPPRSHPTTEPIPFLAAPKSDGLQCRKCYYISRHVQKIQDHSCKMHNWCDPRGKRRPASGVDSRVELPWRADVHCQRFFPTRAGSRWFEVRRRGTMRKKLPGITSSSIADLSAEPCSLTPEAYAHVKR